MHLSFLPALLALSSSVSAAVVPKADAPALPLDQFKTDGAKPLTLSELLALPRNDTIVVPEPQSERMGLMATCTNPRVRTEWDNYSNSDRQAFVNAIKCLMGKPRSGAFPQSKNKYEDLVALHQSLTPNVHTLSGARFRNAKFLIWHRYFLWTFEDLLRTECGFDRNLPWFDETKYAGKFSQSSIFSAQWFGGIAFGGRCVNNGQFAGLTLNVGPGPGNQAHCLARNGDSTKTANTNSAVVNACNDRTTYADMAGCAEGGAHAWGHNGIGAVMQDAYASPGDPVFWLHHAFIDRNYRIWQNKDSARVGYIDGTDSSGKSLTLDTGVSVNGIRPSVTIREIINTVGDKLCYRYNY